MIDPRVNKETAGYVEEAFVVDVQSFLHHLMVEKGFNRSQLAEAMGVSRARVTQIFSDECKNFTIRLLARAVHALGEKPEITSSWHTDCVTSEEAETKERPASVFEIVYSHRWDMGVANDDDEDFDDCRQARPDQRIAAALMDRARRQQSVPRMEAYA